MTEEDWLSTSDHLRLLQAVDQTGTSQRKVILFVVSVHYQSVESIRDPSQDRMIDGLELYADSTIDREKLDQIFMEEAVHDGASLSTPPRMPAPTSESRSRTSATAWRVVRSRTADSTTASTSGANTCVSA